MVIMSLKSLNRDMTVNHMPFQQGLWFYYNGFRYIDYYDILTFDGQLHEFVYPNGDEFYPMESGPMESGGVIVNDRDVKYISLVEDSRLDSKLHYTGIEREKRNLDMFSSKMKLENPSYQPFIPVFYRYFD